MTVCQTCQRGVVRRSECFSVSHTADFPAACRAMRLPLDVPSHDAWQEVPACTHAPCKRVCMHGRPDQLEGPWVDGRHVSKCSSAGRDINQPADRGFEVCWTLGMTTCNIRAACSEAVLPYCVRRGGHVKPNRWQCQADLLRRALRVLARKGPTCICALATRRSVSCRASAMTCTGALSGAAPLGAARHTRSAEVSINLVHALAV